MDSWLVLVANGKAGTISALEYSGSRLRPLADNRIGAQGMPLAVAAERGLVFAGTIDPWLIRVLAVDRATGRLTEIHRLPIAGNPVHLALSANGRWLAMASYHDGLGQLCRVEADGVLEPIGEPVRHRNLHSAAITADTRHCYFVSLRDDLVAGYLLDADRGLVPLDPPATAAPAGSGPRHLVFDASQTQLYVNTEYSGEVLRYRRETVSGALELVDRVPNVPGQGLGHSRFGADPRVERLIWGSELRLATAGDRLYSAERTSATITAQPVGPDGSVGSPTASSPVLAQPRGFAVLPDDKLLVASETTARIGLYATDATGRLKLIQAQPVGAGPVWIGLLPRSTLKKPVQLVDFHRDIDYLVPIEKVGADRRAEILHAAEGDLTAIG